MDFQCIIIAVQSCVNLSERKRLMQTWIDVELEKFSSSLNYWRELASRYNAELLQHSITLLRHLGGHSMTQCKLYAKSRPMTHGPPMSCRIRAAGIHQMQLLATPLNERLRTHQGQLTNVVIAVSAIVGLSVLILIVVWIELKWLLNDLKSGVIKVSYYRANEKYLNYVFSLTSRNQHLYVVSVHRLGLLHPALIWQLVQLSTDEITNYNNDYFCHRHNVSGHLLSWTFARGAYYVIELRRKYVVWAVGPVTENIMKPGEEQEDILNSAYIACSSLFFLWGCSCQFIIYLFSYWTLGCPLQQEHCSS